MRIKQNNPDNKTIQRLECANKRSVNVNSLCLSLFDYLQTVALRLSSISYSTHPFICTFTEHFMCVWQINVRDGPWQQRGPRIAVKQKSKRVITTWIHMYFLRQRWECCVCQMRLILLGNNPSWSLEFLQVLWADVLVAFWFQTIFSFFFFLIYFY